MNTAKNFGKSLLACLLTVCLLVSLIPAAYADDTPQTEPAEGGELRIADIGDVPEGGSFDAVYIESSVGNEDVELKGIEATDLVVQGGKSLSLDEECSFENISMQHENEAFSFVAETGAQIKNLLVESAKAGLTVKGSIGNLELKSDNADVTVESGSIDNSNVIGKNAKLTIGKNAVSATLTVEDTATDSQVIVQGSVVTATAQADNSTVTVDNGGSVAILSTGEDTKDASFQIGGVVGHVVVTENSSGVKVNVTAGATVTAIGAAASVEINVDDGATVSHLVSATNAIISGNAKADDVQVKDDVISGGIVNFATATTTAQETVTEQVEETVKEIVPDWAVAKSGSDYYTDFQSALYAAGNVTLYAGQIYGVYSVSGYNTLTLSELTEDLSGVRINMWDMGIEGWTDDDGNECPQYLPITDETVYNNADGDKTAAAKEAYEYICSMAQSEDLLERYTYSYWYAVFIDENKGLSSISCYDKYQVIVPYSKAIDLNGNTIIKADGNGNGLRLGQTTLGAPTNNQTFYVSNGKFIGEQYTYDYNNVEDKTSYDPNAWVDTGKALSGSGNTLNMRENSTYIIDNCEFENGYVQLDLGKNNDNSMVNAVYFDECSFYNTNVKIDSSSYDNQTDGYLVDVNFNDCSFTIDNSNGQIYLSHYIWGNVNFSNCNFVTTSSTKPISNSANTSNANHDLVITFEDCTLNGTLITAENVANMGLTKNVVTTVYVNNEGEEVVKALDSTGKTQEETNENPIQPESAETNTLLAEAEAEEVLGVEILTADEQAQVAELTADPVGQSGEQIVGDAGVDYSEGEA